MTIDDTRIRTRLVGSFAKIESGSGIDISRDRDEESGGTAFLSGSGASNGDFRRHVMANLNPESTAHTHTASVSKTDGVHAIRLKLEELERQHVVSISKQAETNEEFNFLLENYQFPINEIAPVDHTPERKNRGLSLKFGRNSSLLTESDLITSLDEDTFSLMMISRVGSKSWILGIVSTYSSLVFRLIHSPLKYLDSLHPSHLCMTVFI